MSAFYTTPTHIGCLCGRQIPLTLLKNGKPRRHNCKLGKVRIDKRGVWLMNLSREPAIYKAVWLP